MELLPLVLFRVNCLRFNLTRTDHNVQIGCLRTLANREAEAMVEVSVSAEHLSLQLELMLVAAAGRCSRIVVVLGSDICI